MEFPRIELERTSIGADLLTLAKAHLRISGTDEDTEITRYLNTAVRRWEDDTRRLLIQKTVKEYYDTWPWNYSGRTLYLRRAPVVSVTSVKYYDLDGSLQTWASTNYATDLVGEPARIVLADDATISYPSVDDRPNAVVIEYESGMGSPGVGEDATDVLEADTINAILVYAGYLYGDGRALSCCVDAQAVMRCWYSEIRRMQWTL